MLIICPLKLEMTHLLNGFSVLGLSAPLQKCDKGISFAHFPEQKLTVSVGGHGKAQFALQTHYLALTHGPFENVLCVGSAGGLSLDVKVGDVVVAETTIEHDYNERFNSKASLPQFQAHEVLVRRFLGGDSEVRRMSSFSVFRGAVASGDEDIANHERAADLWQKTGALAVAWEGAGGARASRFLGLNYLELRVITDNARENVASSFTENLPGCMANLARLILESPPTR